MAAGENVGERAVERFLEIHDELEDDPRFMGKMQLIPFAALARFFAEYTEHASKRTEIECKKELHELLGREGDDRTVT